jgi:hypothetical protein
MLASGVLILAFLDKAMTSIASGGGRHGSADPDLDPNPHQMSLICSTDVKPKQTGINSKEYTFCIIK